jgi:predicted RNA polymerase sigma factor
MEIQASRLGARTDSRGEIVLLLDQNRARWDRLLIRRGLAALDRALEVGAGALGPYGLQAAIAACHARATTAEQTDWHEIARLYGLLVQIMPSPVVELNRAVAVSMADGPAAGLAIVDTLVDVPSLASYHLLPSVRGDLLFRLDRFDEAQVEFLRAASMTANRRERELLQRRARSCTESGT